MTSFAELGLSAASVQRIDDLGFTTPTDIQTQAIPALLAGQDVVGVAQTGTGKTAAFGLPLLSAIRPHGDQNAGQVQALVLTPTRELAMQVAGAVAELADAGTTVLPIYGGAPFGPQLRGLANGAPVVVGTPGRVIDMIDRGALDLSRLQYVVLDEADEMLQMGFAEDVDRILTGANAQRQTALFSATMPAAIRKVARTHMTNPVELSAARTSPTTTTITQEYAVVPFRHKVGALARLLSTCAAEAAIVFVRTRKDAEEVGAQLTSRGISAASISGDVAQRDRERIVQRLRDGSLGVLVATDVAARGLDVDRLGLVVNFDVPREVDAYIHRIGRTGRAGRSGRAITFFTPKERSRLRQIEKATGATVAPIEIPTPAQVSAHRAEKLLADIPGRIELGRLEEYREQLATMVADQGIDLLDAAAALVATTIGDAGPRQGGEAEADSQATFTFDARTDSGSRRKAPSTGRGTVYRIAVGRNHGARPEAIVGAVTGEARLNGSDLGKITINSSFSLVEIIPELDEQQRRRLDRAMVAGAPLRLRPDTGRAPHRGNGQFRGRNDRRGSHPGSGPRQRAPQRAGR